MLIKIRPFDLTWFLSYLVMLPAVWTSRNGLKSCYPVCHSWRRVSKNDGFILILEVWEGNGWKQTNKEGTNDQTGGLLEIGVLIKRGETQNQTVCLKLNSVLSRYGSELSEYRERVLKCHYHGRLVKTTIEKRSSDQTDSLLESVFLVKGGETEKY